jgi:peptidoglycan/xylan/chitin deacetylase (PgdA/CDA1 family)
MKTLGRRILRRAKARVYGLLGVPAARVAVALLRISRARLGIAVVYHRIGDPPGDPARELVPALGSHLFRRQVNFMAGCFRLVPASELRSAISQRRRWERFPATITFDDDLAAHRDAAMPILQAAGAPATFFLTGASLERPFAFWWDRLERALARELPVEPVLGFDVDRDDSGRPDIWAINERVVAMRPRERDALAARLEAALGPDPDDGGLSAGDIGALVEGGLEIGFHTRSHYFLPLLEDDELAGELHQGTAELEAVTGRSLETIAYPYGGFDARVAGAAGDAGFASGFTTEPRAASEHDEPLLMPRVEAPFDSAGHLALRLARALGEAVRG